ncbi:serine/threonine protein kinase, partial [Mycobacterium persicum]
ARIAGNPTSRATAPRRSRPATGGNRPPARRTFSSGQRALLWAAGVLGALAIIIAVLIVINSRGDNQPQSPPPTVTDTGTPPASQTPTGQGLRPGATGFGRLDNDGRDGSQWGRFRPPGASRADQLGRTVAPRPTHHASLDRYETSR